jgi:Sporulation and spore germination
MIPRYQRVLFWLLSVAILLMAGFLLHGCEQAREKLTRHRDETPLEAPVGTPSGTVHLAMANDADGTITMVEREAALPEEPTARARALLTRLIAEYSYKNSAHPLESGPAVDDVFLLDLPLKPATAAGAQPAPNSSAAPLTAEDSAIEAQPSGGQLAVVNLHGTFADHHPSGIEPETLTIDSILGTLYANFPRIEQVRFLVDGQSRDTLNGHTDLARIYTVADTATKPAAQTTPQGAQAVEVAGEGH